jgi:hypothetical protein
MITALAENRRMTDVFGELLERHAAFRDRVITFAAMWPVLNVRDVVSVQLDGKAVQEEQSAPVRDPIFRRACAPARHRPRRQPANRR